MTFCQTLGPCQRAGCGRPACDHSALNQHPLYDYRTSCEGYVPSEEQAEAFGEFEGGGGSSGGGGASGSW